MLPGRLTRSGHRFTVPPGLFPDTVTLLLGFGFWMMDAVPVGRAVAALVWLGHVYVLFRRIPTLAPGAEHAP